MYPIGCDGVMLLGPSQLGFLPKDSFKGPAQHPRGAESLGFGGFKYFWEIFAPNEVGLTAEVLPREILGIYECQGFYIF